jgi:hypothetical protein
MDSEMMREERAVMCVCRKGLTLLKGGVPAPTHVCMPNSGQIRPERFPVQNGSRVPAFRKGGTSGMFLPDSAGIRPEQESCPGFQHPENRNENRNVQPSP